MTCATSSSAASNLDCHCTTDAAGTRRWHTLALVRLTTCEDAKGTGRAQLCLAERQAATCVCAVCVQACACMCACVYAPLLGLAASVKSTQLPSRVKDKSMVITQAGPTPQGKVEHTEVD
eukprot:1162051-Pelagomonas_calceolata.AAC.9